MRTNSTELLRQEIVRSRHVLRYLQDVQDYPPSESDHITAPLRIGAPSQYIQSELDNTEAVGFEDFAWIAPLIDDSVDSQDRNPTHSFVDSQTERRVSSASAKGLPSPTQDVHRTAQSPIVVDLVSAIHSTMSIFSGISDPGRSVNGDYEENDQDNSAASSTVVNLHGYCDSAVGSDVDRGFIASENGTQGLVEVISTAPTCPSLRDSTHATDAEEWQAMATDNKLNCSSLPGVFNTENNRDSTYAYVNNDYGLLSNNLRGNPRIANEINSTPAFTNQLSRSSCLLTSSSSFAEAATRFRDPMYLRPVLPRLYSRASVLTDRTIFRDGRSVRPLHRSRSAVVVYHIRKWAGMHLSDQPRSPSLRLTSIAKRVGSKVKHSRSDVGTFLRRMC
jgi:hypothetical protein